MRRRVVVTGMGAVSPHAAGAQAFFAALVEGRSAVRRLDRDPDSPLASRIGAAVAYDLAPLAPAQARMLDRVSRMALMAAAEAVGQSGGALEGLDRARACVCVGTGMGGAETTDDGYRTLYAERSDRIKPYSVLLAMNNAPAAWIALEYAITGPNLTFSTACSSSAVAIGEAFRRILHGEAELAIAGGAEAPLTYGTLRAWEALRTLAPADARDVGASCKPFSRNRAGLVLGEGAAMVVLEDRERALARGAAILGEIVGYGLCNDAGHITRPSVAGQARAMRLALEDARMEGARIGYINAHGTGTEANDPVETAAIREVFGASARDIAVSSTKSMHGHLLGAAGALEFVASLQALAAGTIPPTMHLDEPDPACDLDYVPGRARPAPKLEAVMSNSFAFGGTNAVLVAQR